MPASTSTRGRTSAVCGCARSSASAPFTADATIATLGSAKDFRNGRQLAAWLGLVPTQHSSGGHARLGTISCRGDAYLRTLLIQGARSSLQRAKVVSVEKSTPEQIWIRQLICRMPFRKVLVAIANKHARQLWVMLAHDETYDADAWLKHSMVRAPPANTPSRSPRWHELAPVNEHIPRQREAVATGQTHLERT